MKKGEGENAEVVEIPCDADKPLVAHVFKVTTDPYIGKLAMLRILQGKMDNYAIDLWAPYFSAIADVAHKKYHGTFPSSDVGSGGGGGGGAVSAWRMSYRLCSA